MTNSKLSTTKAAVMAIFILLVAVPLQAHAFVFLVAIKASKSGSDKAMKASDIMTVLVKNTAVAEMTEGTGYAFFRTNGRLVGRHPEHGRLVGYWRVGSVGEICITWIYPSGSITNCAYMTDLGKGKYQWGDRKVSFRKGDVKNLDKM